MAIGIVLNRTEVQASVWRLGLRVGLRPQPLLWGLGHHMILIFALREVEGGHARRLALCVIGLKFRAQFGGLDFGCN